LATLQTLITWELEVWHVPKPSEQGGTHENNNRHGL